MRMGGQIEWSWCTKRSRDINIGANYSVNVWQLYLTSWERLPSESPIAML